MHRHNIIHRDIKPENLVLDSRGYIRITDLGIARTYRHNNSCDTSGTPGYMCKIIFMFSSWSYMQTKSWLRVWFICSWSYCIWADDRKSNFNFIFRDPI